jgi:hypothetical protein
MSTVHHHHHHAPEVRPQWRPHTPPGAVPILDIGDDIGALIVCLPELTPSGELTVQPAGNPAGHFHTGVHERSGVWTAIFPEMVEGDYELIDDDGHWLADVTVTGGEVEELDLRSRAG